MGPLREGPPRPAFYPAPGVCRRAPPTGASRLALVNVADRPYRATEAEAAAKAGAPIEEIADLATRDLEPVADLHASSAYRKHVAGVLVRRALTEIRSA